MSQSCCAYMQHICQFGKGSHFLSSLRIGVSPSYYNKKSDEFGQLFNNVMIQQKQEDEAVLKSSGVSALQ